MSNTATLRYLPILVALLPAACAQPGGGVSMIDARADRSAYGMGLDSRDFDAAAVDAVTEMLSSPAITNKPGGGRWVMAISRVTNDTMQRIDTDQLIKRIRVELLKSGKVVTTTTIGANGPEDPLQMEQRSQLRGSREFNQATIGRRGTMVAADLTLSGKLIQQNNRLGDGSQRVDYEFQLTLSDNRGLAIWEGQKPINKVGSNRTVAW